MAEGPVNFGKPLFILVLLGCAGAGFWAYKNWPSHYEGQGWGIDWPNKWESSDANDAARPGKIISNGPLKNEEHGAGVGWVTVNFHGALNFQPFVEEKLGYTLEKLETGFDIGNKTALMFEYEEQDKGFRYLGAAVDRGDAVVLAVIGCRKGVFEDNKEHFTKVLKSLRCTR